MITVLDTPCREWQGARTKKGYGIKGKRTSVHRWVWEAINGPIPEGMVIMHRCDNPPCFRYDHLQLGTQSENIRDAYAKGRMSLKRTGSPGVRNGMSKLTEDEVCAIRADERSHAAIAEDHGVTRQTVGKIKSGQRWGKVL